MSLQKMLADLFKTVQCNTTARQKLTADSIVWDLADTPWSVFWERLPCLPLELFSLCLSVWTRQSVKNTPRWLYAPFHVCHDITNIRYPKQTAVNAACVISTINTPAFAAHSWLHGLMEEAFGAGLVKPGGPTPEAQSHFLYARRPEWKERGVGWGGGIVFSPGSVFDPLPHLFSPGLPHWESWPSVLITSWRSAGEMHAQDGWEGSALCRSKQERFI